MISDFIILATLTSPHVSRWCESTIKVVWSFVIVNLLFSFSVFFQILPYPISWAFWSSLDRRYAVVKSAASTTLLKVGKSKSISITLVACYSHCSCKYDACCSLWALQFYSRCGNFCSASLYHSCICYLWNYNMFTESQGHPECQAPGPAYEHIARTQGFYLFLHLILHMCFPHQFVIRDEVKVFNFLLQVQLHSLMISIMTSLIFLFLVKGTISVFSGFTDGPLVLHQVSIFLRPLCVSSATVLRCLPSPPWSFAYHCVYISKTSLRQFCYSAQVFAVTTMIIRISLCWVSLSI